MTRAEYHKLLKGSRGFKLLSPDSRKKIMNSKGQAMENYAQIYLEEKSELDRQARLFIERTDQAVADFKGSARKVRIQGSQDSESRDRKAEKSEQISLLQTLKKL